MLQYLKYQGVSKYQFYKESGISNGMLDKNRGVSEENILKFLEFAPEIRVEWLITGSGTWFKKDEKDHYRQLLAQEEDTTYNAASRETNTVQRLSMDEWMNDVNEQLTNLQQELKIINDKLNQKQ